MKNITICKRCVMDTTEDNIFFDENGICNHCTKSIHRMRSVVKVDALHLITLIEKIKIAGKGKKYDCILGLSGGVDSSYLAYLANKFGLRVLAVHVDNGWNSEIANMNIENIVKKLNFDLYKKVIDWESFKDLQLAFLKSSTPDLEVPTDHVIHATLFAVARQEKIKYILQGMNMRTEGIMPESWSYGAYDLSYIKSVQKKFGKKNVKNLPHFTLFDRLTNFFIHKLHIVSLLNLIDYKKDEAIEIIKNELDWSDYGGKHGESIYTRFIQSYILPIKFGIDKRKAHLSSLILSNQMSREDALVILQKDPYDEKLFHSDYEFVLNKLEISPNGFSEILSLPRQSYKNFSNQKRMISFISRFIWLGRRLHILPPTSGL